MRLIVGKYYWKIEKQFEWYVKVVRKIIVVLLSGYVEVVDWFDVIENVLFNCFCVDGDQIFLLGWVMVLQCVGGIYFIVDVVVQFVNGVFVFFFDVEDVDNVDINQCLLEVIEQIGSYLKQICLVIEDGVVELYEKIVINDELYFLILKLQEYVVFVYKIFCILESNDVCECVVLGVVVLIVFGCGEINV